MKKIDQAIETHGGWPGAFAVSVTAPNEPAGSGGGLDPQGELDIPKPQDDLPFL
jgi:hypothetical protein